MYIARSYIILSCYRQVSCPKPWMILYLPWLAVIAFYPAFLTRYFVSSEARGDLIFYSRWRKNRSP